MKLILGGGGSGEQTKIINEKLNELVDHNKGILYIPLAMDEEKHSYDSCYEWIKDELSEVEVTNIDMVRTFEELSQKSLDDYTAIFIGGGNTYKLLKGLKEYGIVSLIINYLNNGGIVIGGSAGSVIFGKDIDIISIMDSNDVELKDTSGFNLLFGTSIFPHYMNMKSKLTKKENDIRMNNFTKAITDFSLQIGPVYAIPEENAVYFNGTDVDVIGSKNWFYFENGNKLEKEPDSAFEKEIK